jgi:arabinofuranan 3-O-arabinosyltransferase
VSTDQTITEPVAALTVVTELSLAPPEVSLTELPARRSWARRVLRRIWYGLPDLTPRRYLVVPSLLLLAAALCQRPGKIVADTKVALVLDPGRFLSSALHFWNPLTDSGSVGDQATGYLFPMGPFFFLTHALGIPAATAQRLWLSLLLVLSFWGVVRLADALGIGNRTGRIVGAMAYALSPFVLSRVGDNSALLLGGVALPWVLLPLVRATYAPAPRRGDLYTVEPLSDRPSRPPLSARRAAALSGCAVLIASGINATVTLDMLIAPVLWLALMCRGRTAWALRAWWVAAVVFATAWWIVGLELLAKYGVNFVRYTESAKTTTSVTSLPETVRGTADWLAYLHFGGPELPSAWTYVSALAAIIASFTVAGLGLVGLSRLRVPARRFLLASLAVGVVAVAAAYPGSPHGVFSASWLDALTGPLGAFRNINKFQPLLRLPLALGLAHCLPLIAVKVQSRRRRRLRRATNLLTALVLAGAVVVAAAPLGLSRLYQGGNFTAVPSYWQQASAWLNRSASGSRTLLLPGSGTGSYTWGTPNDEPLLWLSKTPWAVRNLIPLGGVNSTRWLDGIEKQLVQRAAPDLAATLTRAGVGFVLVRNDLSQNSNDPPPTTSQLHSALAYSGLHRVATFGPLVKGRRSGLQIFLKSKADSGRYPALEIYAVPGAGRVSSYPADSLAVLSGGPEALPVLSSTGVLGDRPTVLAADLAAQGAGYAKLSPIISPTGWIDTDTLARRDEQYGSLHSGSSYLLAAGQKAAGESAAPQVRLDVDPNGHQTTALFSGISGVNASHYGFILATTPQSGPQSAVDGNTGSAWSVSGFPNRGVGQWLSLTFPAARSLPNVTVQLLADSAKRVRISALRATTDSGSVVTHLDNTEDPQTIAIPDGMTRTLRLTIVSVAGKSSNSAGYGPGIREVTIGGLPIDQSVALPYDVKPYFPAGGAATLSYVFSRDRDDPHAPLDLDVENQISRTFTVPRDVVLTGSGTAVDHSTVLPASAKRPVVTLACGSGPTVQIDDRTIATSVQGSRTDWLAGQPVALRLCSTKPIALKAGVHTLRTLAGTSSVYRPSLGIATFTLTTAQPRQPAARPATITKWGDEHRTVTMGAGPASILTIHENFNKSWRASANGQQLQAIRIDGWQQGFVVSAGGALTVNIVNKPGIAYRQLLLVSAVLVLLLICAAIWPSRKAREVRAPRAWRGSLVRALSLAGAVVAVLLVAGPGVALGVPVLALIIWVVPRIGPLLAFAGAGVAAGVAAAYPGHYPSSHQGSFSALAQTAMAYAIAVVLLSAGQRGAFGKKARDVNDDSALAAPDNGVMELPEGEAPAPVSAVGEKGSC